MNELRQVLLIIAIIVVGALYLIGRRKKQRNQTQVKTHQNETPSSSPHSAPDDEALYAGNQQILPLDDQLIQEEKPKHIVIEDPDMATIEEVGVPIEDTPIRFGRPENASTQQAEKIERAVEKTEPEAFVIVVMGTGNEFPMKSVQHALLGVGLEFSQEQQIYLKKDSMGNTIIRVANLLEPGTFPAENLEHSATPGVVLILQLPTTIKAPAAMHDLIMMARKISQRLNGRLYNAERQLLKESDLQAMRDVAIAYESTPA